MTLVPPAKGSPPVQKTTEIRRPRANQRLTVSFDDSESDTSGRAAKLQYELAQCVETKTVTTTTTTKRSYPPLFIRQPRPLETLDVKEYPLAQGPTPPDLRKFTLDLSENDDEFAWSFSEPSFTSGDNQVSPALRNVFWMLCGLVTVLTSHLSSPNPSRSRTVSSQTPIVAHLRLNHNLKSPNLLPSRILADPADTPPQISTHQTGPLRGHPAAMQVHQSLIGSEGPFPMVPGRGRLGNHLHCILPPRIGLKSPSRAKCRRG